LEEYMYSHGREHKCKPKSEFRVSVFSERPPLFMGL
jgi:hypothetical protein